MMRYARKYLSSLSVSVVCGGSWLAFGFLTNREREEEEERRKRSLNERRFLSSVVVVARRRVDGNA